MTWFTSVQVFPSITILDLFADLVDVVLPLLDDDMSLRMSPGCMLLAVVKFTSMVVLSLGVCSSTLPRSASWVSDLTMISSNNSVR